MSPRERIRAALARANAERVPFSWGLGHTHEAAVALDAEFSAMGKSWSTLRRKAECVASGWPAYLGPMPEGTPDYVGCWGIRTERVSHSSGHYDEFVGLPLAGADTAADLDKAPWPDLDQFDYASLKGQFADADPEGCRAKKLPGGNPLEIYQWMTGLEESMINLAVAPELASDALARITAIFGAKLERMAAAVGPDIDIVFCGDDLGGQTGPLISGRLYRSLIQPFHASLFARARALFPKASIVYHSDGSVFDLLGDLLDAGIDALDAVQVEAAGMEPERLAKAFGDRLSFHGGISVQSLLPHGTPAEVREACRRLEGSLNAHGGWIAVPSHAIQVGTPAANVWAMLEALGAI